MPLVSPCEGARVPSADGDRRNAGQEPRRSERRSGRPHQLSPREPPCSLWMLWLSCLHTTASESDASGPDPGLVEPANSVPNVGDRLRTVGDKSPTVGAGYPAFRWGLLHGRDTPMWASRDPTVQPILIGHWVHPPGTDRRRSDADFPFLWRVRSDALIRGVLSTLVTVVRLGFVPLRATPGHLLPRILPLRS
jgi:hypothetical protein